MIDSIDRRLLDLMQVDADRTADDLHPHLPLSPSAIARRLRRLRKTGLIERTIALLSPRLTADRLRALVLANWRENCPVHLKHDFIQALREDPEVQFIFEITGRVHVMALVCCTNMEKVNLLLERRFATHDAIERHETHFVMKMSKFEPFVRQHESE